MDSSIKIAKDNTVMVISPYMLTLKRDYKDEWFGMSKTLPQLIVVNDCNNINKNNGMSLVHLLVFLNKNDVEIGLEKINNLSRRILNINIAKKLSNVSEEEMSLLERGKCISFCNK